jgi:endoglucanase
MHLRSLLSLAALAAALTALPATLRATIEWGVNLAGGEFAGKNSASVPGVYGEFSDYCYPDDDTHFPSDLEYYASKNLKLVRLPILWERVQPTLNGSLNQTEVNRIKDFISDANGKGMKVIVDLHNYCRYWTTINGVRKHAVLGRDIDKATLGDFWYKLVGELDGYGNIWAWDIMNEPHNLGSDGSNELDDGKTLWKDTAQIAINEIRRRGSTKRILVPGYFWSNGYRWVEFSDNLKNLTDSANNLVYQAHSYFDRDYSGTYQNTPTRTTASTAPTAAGNCSRPSSTGCVPTAKKASSARAACPPTANPSGRPASRTTSPT